jgi:hypothetical protein
MSHSYKISDQLWISPLLSGPLEHKLLQGVNESVPRQKARLNIKPIVALLAHKRRKTHKSKYIPPPIRAGCMDTKVQHHKQKKHTKSLFFNQSTDCLFYGTKCHVAFVRCWIAFYGPPPCKFLRLKATIASTKHTNNRPFSLMSPAHLTLLTMVAILGQKCLATDSYTPRLKSTTLAGRSSNDIHLHSENSGAP